MQGVFINCMLYLTYPLECVILGKSGNSVKELVMKKINKALKEAIVWGVVIVIEMIFFLTYFRFGEWFKATLPAVIASIAAILFRVLICLFRYKETPLPWEKSTNKDYTALIEAVICIALVIGAFFWIKSLPQDAGYGDLIVALPTVLICQGLFVRGVLCVNKFIGSLKK